MEKLNIAELLKNCPTGMELDCMMFEDMHFDHISDCGKFIYCYINYKDRKTSISSNKYGAYCNLDKSKCVLFPKGKTTWEGFQRPFKDGDILAYTSSHTTVFIYRNKENEPKYATSFYVGHTIGERYHNFHIYNKYTLIALNGDCDVRFATEEEKQKLFQAIKDNGYKWNDETKILEKLIEPKFKVGDRVKSKITQYEYTIVDIRKDVYIMNYTTDKFGYHVPFCNEDNFELVPNKFDINTLKPFDKVLVRDTKEQVWVADLFSHMVKRPLGGYTFACVGHYSNQCIPYEGNEHLLGTTNDCNDYFKVWKK